MFTVKAFLENDSTLLRQGNTVDILRNRGQDISVVLYDNNAVCVQEFIITPEGEIDKIIIENSEGNNTQSIFRNQV